VTRLEGGPVPAHNASERAEQRMLREQMRGSGMSYAEIAAEMARRYQFRPRKAPGGTTPCAPKAPRRP